MIVSNPFASPFQTPAFYDFLNSVPGYSAVALAVENGDALCALVVAALQQERGIKAYFSRRGIIYGGPLFDPEEPQGLEILLKGLDAMLSRQVIYLETRNFFDYAAAKQIFSNHKWLYAPYLNLQIDTADQAGLLKNISSSRMRQIKKAGKSGVLWRQAESIAEVEQFYRILETLYCHRVKKPLPSWDFFRLFFEMMIGKYLLIFFEDKVIGGIMCPVLDKRAIYEFYICGMDDQYKEQYPSVMATWAAIEYAVQNKIAMFDFMGAGKPEEAYGVREFKARFGGELVEHGRFLKVTQPVLYSIGKVGLKMMARIK